MSDPETELMEKELSRLRPAPAPEPLLARLERLGPRRRESRAARPARAPIWPTFTRWFIPAAALPILVLAGLSWLHSQAPPDPPTRPNPRSQASTSANEPVAAQSGAGAEQVHIDQRLLAAFETVAEVPGQGPVRFRFSEWEDRVVVRAPNSGFAVERRTPRFEIVPVRYESY